VLEEAPLLPIALAAPSADTSRVRPGGLMSRAERSRAVERGLTGLYRWYVARSQAQRNWNPDTDFDWRRLRRDHDDPLHHIIEGFYGVEQYAPDYVRTLLRVIRESYGRSHFHLRWGAEEEKHADLWRNAVLSLGRRSVDWVEARTAALRANRYELPWDDALHMLFFTVLQERATYVVYHALERAARGETAANRLGSVEDPVLATVCTTIARDEAAHYHFYLEAARLFLYYFPEDSVAALVDVMRHFAMPAADIVPDYDTFTRALHRAGLFGPRMHHRDVVSVALEHLGMPGLRALEHGVRRTRTLPDSSESGADIWQWVDSARVARAASGVFDRVRRYAESAGVAHTMSARFDIAWSPEEQP
jgi:acyl-[acyl-carrier protein] desaturase